MNWRATFICVVLAACSRGEHLGGRGPVRELRRPLVPVTGEVRRDAPMVRVGIAVDTPAVAVGAPAPFELRRLTGEVLARGNAGEPWELRRAAGQRVQVVHGSSTEAYDLPVRVTTTAGDFVDIAGRRYRGSAIISARGEDRISAVNVVELEQYLLGVVPREMGRRPAEEIEALKAQAVAARTYAIGNLGGREELGFDFYATILDQVYGGQADEDSIVSRAVRSTRGEIVTYRGQPIMAYYSSTCGGHTADIEQSWPNRSPQPYLRGVSDRIPGTDSYYCESSSRFRWRTEWTRAQLLAVLGQTLAAHTANAITEARRVSDVRLTRRPGAGERAIVQLTVNGKKLTLRGDSIRWLLRPAPGSAILNSSLLSALAISRTRGQVERLTIEGGGWGHGIGMCQVGAMGRARAGQSYREILRAYYTDTSIERAY
ncbi:MAG: SpoIID/LytB domain-containing protein [Gemmatimonadetes bacterium]|nr:SpoIID/LytB domain-containing protein [Gemmatimonadota bacterium]